MSIRFPKMHIARSVMNQILNAAADIEQMRGGRPTHARPHAPEPNPAGAMLDAQLQQPTPPVGELGGPESDTANATEAVLSGGSSLQGLLDTVSGR